MAEEKPRRKVTINQLRRKAREGEQIVQMAIYDYRSAVIADRLGIDILCVSDTGGMILFGHKSTVTVTFEGTLQAAPTVNGPWENVDAASPLTIPADQAAQFGRAVRE